MKRTLLHIVCLLQYESHRPKSYGLFHLICLFTSLLAAWMLISRQETDHEKSLKKVLLFYGWIALILELMKQVVWSYDGQKWSYQWYAAPFQLCTTPIYACLLASCLPKCRIRDGLLSYVAYVTMLGSLATAAYPESCFVKTVLVNIHTMFLHMGSLSVSVYLIFKEISPVRRSWISGYKTFLLFVSIAEVLNVTVYHSGILNGQTFNMFYISPYFISALPVFSAIQQHVKFLLFLLIYLTAIFVGSGCIYLLSSTFNKFIRIAG